MDEDSASPESMMALKELMAKPDNHICADCNARDPKWASSNIGVFICIKCSGVHRSLGTHISKVLSLSLDQWTDNQVETMLEIGGNASANAIYEAYLPQGVIKPSSAASVEERLDYIRRKYEDQEFVKPSLRLPSIASSVSMHSSVSAHSNQFLKGNLSSRSNSQTNVGMVEFQGLLKVRIIKGTNLAVRDVKSSDPYVVVSIGHQTMKTRVINSNLNPIWNEELMLSVPSTSPKLKLQVFDKDLLSADDSMGEAEVDIQPLVSAASLHEGVIPNSRMQVGKWLATDDNALVEDSLIWIKEDGHVTQGVLLKLQNVESGLIDLDLEWVPLNQ